jgi:hypothetical protein
MTQLCTICEKPLNDGRPVQQDFDGDAVHVDCLEEQRLDEEGDDDA